MDWIKKIFAPVNRPPSREPPPQAAAPVEETPAPPPFSGIRDTGGNVLLETMPASFDALLKLAATGNIRLDAGDLREWAIKAESLTGLTGKGIRLDKSKLQGAMTTVALEAPSFKNFRLEGDETLISSCSLPDSDFTDAHFHTRKKESGSWDIYVTDTILDRSKFHGLSACCQELCFINCSLKDVDLSKVSPDLKIAFTAMNDRFYRRGEYARPNDGCDLDGARLPAERISQFSFKRLDPASPQNVTLVFADGRERPARLTTAGPIFTDKAARTPTPEESERVAARPDQDKIDGVRAAREKLRKPGMDA
jgi:uncharacterized protein YjbI with pentapeptide repeats